VKPAAFEYVRPRDVAEAVRALAAAPGAKVLAGGQTLGPMLNLRLAQPAVLVDITRIAELAAVAAGPDGVILGAIVTHAAIEDGRAAGPPGLVGPVGRFLARVARGIAYRAVRNRGTIGGSLAHADPAADWITALAALGAEVEIAGPAGRRRAAVADFVRGAMQADLGEDELVVGVRVPAFSPAARLGFHKICRKVGEFADAIGAVAIDPEAGLARAVAGAGGGRPLVMDMAAGSGPGALPAAASEALLKGANFAGDAFDLKLAAAALQRAYAEAMAP
jgi:carbon-monoxide dehydrogenase medium subunit